jgi:hypothetical protein
MSQEFSPFSGQMHTTAEQITCGAHPLWIDIRHGHHATSEQYSDLMSIYLVVFGFSPVDRFHVEGMSQYKVNVFLCAKVSQPVPGKDALNGNDDIFPIRRDGFKKHLGICSDIPVNHYFSILIHNAYVHRLCVQIDTTVKFVLLGVKFHTGPPL